MAPGTAGMEANLITELPLEIVLNHIAPKIKSVVDCISFVTAYRDVTGVQKWLKTSKFRKVLNGQILDTSPADIHEALNNRVYPKMCRLVSRFILSKLLGIQYEHEASKKRLLTQSIFCNFLQNAPKTFSIIYLKSIDMILPDCAEIPAHNLNAYISEFDANTPQGFKRLACLSAYTVACADAYHKKTDTVRVRVFDDTAADVNMSLLPTGRFRFVPSELITAFELSRSFVNDSRNFWKVMRCRDQSDMRSLGALAYCPRIKLSTVFSKCHASKLEIYGIESLRSVARFNGQAAPNNSRRHIDVDFIKELMGHPQRRGQIRRGTGTPIVKNIWDPREVVFAGYDIYSTRTATIPTCHVHRCTGICEPQHDSADSSASNTTSAEGVSNNFHIIERNVLNVLALCRRLENITLRNLEIGRQSGTLRKCRCGDMTSKVSVNKLFQRNQKLRSIRILHGEVGMEFYKCPLKLRRSILMITSRFDRSRKRKASRKTFTRLYSGREIKVRDFDR